MNQPCSMNHVEMFLKEESCPIWMSLILYEWVMSHMNESCSVSMSNVTYEWVMSHMNEPYVYKSCH